MAYKRGNYTANHKGTAAFLKSEELADGTYEAARDIAKRARALAPHSGDGQGTPYADGIVIERNNTAGPKGDRIGYDVVATEGHPTLVEWGRQPSKNHPGYEGDHVMRRAMEEVTE